MENYIYKCVPVPTTIDIGAKGQHDAAVKAYEQVINNGAEGGWEFVDIDSITSYKPVGCWGSLTGQKAETITFKMIIFRKEK
jgi:hypothetical protein